MNNVCPLEVTQTLFDGVNDHNQWVDDLKDDVSFPPLRDFIERLKEPCSNGVTNCGECEHIVAVTDREHTPSFDRHYCSHPDELQLDSHELQYLGLGGALRVQPKWCPLGDDVEAQIKHYDETEDFDA